MKERTSLGGEAFIFLVFWLVAGILWGMWLTGISVPFLGLFSAVVFRFIVFFVRWMDKNL